MDEDVEAIEITMIGMWNRYDKVIIERATFNLSSNL